MTKRYIVCVVSNVMDRLEPLAVYGLGDSEKFRTKGDAFKAIEFQYLELRPNLKFSIVPVYSMDKTLK